MTSSARTPTRLYKYRAFDSRLVDILVEDKVFFAEPSTFNDPLDTRPEVEPDLDNPELEEVLERLTTARISSEMTAAAKRIRYRGPKTLAHIEDHTRREVKLLLRDIAYQATDPTYEELAPFPQQRLLAMHIARELQRQHERGVLSLGARYDSVLMWSHYGDQHRGVCIGYSMHRLSKVVPQPVRYGGNRLIPASRIRAMLNGDQDARALVDRDALLRKAADWRYEKEWRVLSTKGLTDSPLELREVIFAPNRVLKPFTMAVLNGGTSVGCRK